MKKQNKHENKLNKEMKLVRAKTGTKKQVKDSYSKGRVVFCYNMTSQAYKSCKDYNRQKYKKISPSDY